MLKLYNLNVFNKLQTLFLYISEEIIVKKIIGKLEIPS